MSNRRYDIAVIGLGAMGSAALYQLSKLGLNVIGIDKYAPPHTLGSSFGESRVTRQAIGESAIYTPLVQRANEIWKELEQLSGKDLFNHCGMLLAGHKEHRFMQNTLQAAKEFSIEHELLAAEEVERRFPAIKVSGKDHLFYYEPDSGYLKPEKCVEVQLRLAEQNGAEALLNTTVNAINESSESVELTLQNGETITAGKVIVASGPWIKDMLPDALGPILKTYLQTQYWFEVDPEHADELQPGIMPVFLCGDEKKETTRSFYNFPLVNGPEGGMKFAVHESDLEVSPEDKDGAKPVTSAEEIYRFISSYIRYIKPETVRSANCLYNMTPDENFIIDFAPNSKRIVLASACSGHGFKHSAAIGEVLAQLATRGTSAIDVSSFRLERFTV
jgi:sarcosine oxidase